MARRLLILAVATLALGMAPEAQDWPQMLGPSRDGIYAGPPLADKWGANGPRTVWRKTVGHGLSGPVVMGTRVILFHRIGNREVVEAMNAGTGATWNRCSS